MFTGLSLRPFGLVSRRERAQPDPHGAPDGRAAAALDGLETARDEVMGACDKVADLQARLAGEDTADAVAGRRPAGGMPARVGYAVLVSVGALLAAGSAYRLLSAVALPTPWVALPAAAALGAQTALGASRLGERLRDLSMRWRQRPWDRHLALRLATPGTLLAGVGAILLLVPPGPATLALLAVGTALGVAGWMAADPDRDQGALIADLQDARRVRDQLCRDYARRWAAARKSALATIDDLALPGDSDDARNSRKATG